MAFDSGKLAQAIEHVGQASDVLRTAAQHVEDLAEGLRGAVDIKDEDSDHLEHLRQRTWQSLKELEAIGRELAELRDHLTVGG
jgi:hypothetical protein